MQPASSSVQGGGQHQTKGGTVVASARATAATKGGSRVTKLRRDSTSVLAKFELKAGERQTVQEHCDFLESSSFTRPELISVGGQGYVFWALDMSAASGSDRTGAPAVVIKVLRKREGSTESENDIASRRFARESAITTQLRDETAGDHKLGIVEVRKVIENPTTGSKYLVVGMVTKKTEPGEGVKPADTLADKIDALHGAQDRRAFRVGLSECLELFKQLCEIVEYVHSRGVLHGDIKSTNVMVDPHSLQKRAVLGDFGIAHIFDEKKLQGSERPQTSEWNSLTEGVGAFSINLDSIMAGTFGYSAPEVFGLIDRVKRGIPSDVYSLGAILYDILVGHEPHRDDFEGQVSKHGQINDLSVLLRPPALTHSGKGPLKIKIDESLRRVCLKALATKPSDRYQTARELGDDIKRFTAAVAVSVRRDPFYVAHLALRRHWRGIAAGAIISGSLVGVGLESRRSYIAEVDKNARELLAGAVSRFQNGGAVGRQAALGTVEALLGTKGPYDSTKVELENYRDIMRRLVQAREVADEVDELINTGVGLCGQSDGKVRNNEIIQKCEQLCAEIAEVQRLQSGGSFIVLDEKGKEALVKDKDYYSNVASVRRALLDPSAGASLAGLQMAQRNCARDCILVGDSLLVGDKVAEAIKAWQDAMVFDHSNRAALLRLHYAAKMSGTHSNK